MSQKSNFNNAKKYIKCNRYSKLFFRKGFSIGIIFILISSIFVLKVTENVNASPPYSINILQNPGFEDDDIAPFDSPDSWEDAGENISGDSDAIYDNSESHSGNWSYQLNHTYKNIMRYSEYFLLKPNSNVKFGGWIKANNSRNKTNNNTNYPVKYIYLHQYDENNNRITFSATSPLYGNFNWTEKNKTVGTPSNIMKGRLSIYMYHGSYAGTAWFDDLYVLPEEVVHEPTIITWSPIDLTPPVNHYTENVNFSINYLEYDGDTVNVTWYLNGNIVNTSQSQQMYSTKYYVLNFNDSHFPVTLENINITVKINDSDGTDIRTWILGSYYQRRIENLNGLLGTYAKYIKNQDGTLDVTSMINELKNNHYNTFGFNIYNETHYANYSAFKEFLKEAEIEGIRIYAGLAAHDETIEEIGPYYNNWTKWAEELAKLSLLYPNLLGLYIDDFEYEDQDTLSKQNLENIANAAFEINPLFYFTPLKYNYWEMKDFFEEFHKSSDSVTFCYRGYGLESSRSNPLEIINQTKIAQEGKANYALNTLPYATYTFGYYSNNTLNMGTHYEIEQSYLYSDYVTPYILNYGNKEAKDLYIKWEDIRSSSIDNGYFYNNDSWEFSNTSNSGFSGNYSTILNHTDNLSRVYQISYDNSTQAQQNDYGEISQSFEIPPSTRFRITARIKDDLNETYNGSNSEYVYFQLLIDDRLIFEKDLASGIINDTDSYIDEGWNIIDQDITGIISHSDSDNAKVTLKIIFNKSSSNFPSFNLSIEDVILKTTQLGFGNKNFEDTSFPGTHWRFVNSRKWGDIVRIQPYGETSYNVYWVGNWTDDHGNYDNVTKIEGNHSYRLSMNETFSSNDYVQISQVINLPLRENFVIGFSAKDNYNSSVTGKYLKQFIVNDQVIWEDDVAGNEGWETLTPDLKQYLNNSTKAEVIFRLLNVNGSQNISFWVDGVSIMVNPRVYNVNQKIWYMNIQPAINESNSGDKILAFNYTFYENITVKSNITLEGVGTPIIDGNQNQAVVLFNNSSISTLINFSIINGNDGIQFINSSNITIENCNVSSNSIGINITDYSSYNNLINNVIKNNTNGIQITNHSNWNNLSENDIFVNLYIGIYIQDSSNYNSIMNNNISNDGDGIYIESSEYTNISFNYICNNNGRGIYLGGYYSNHTYIYKNNISINHIGIEIEGDSAYNSILNNTFYNNSEYAINFLSGWECNIYYNNFYYNNGATTIYDPMHIQASDMSTNYWDDGSLGNFWIDWTWPDTSPDDGIVDDPYEIDGGMFDYCPSETPL
jgi:parallel beta-helix repeat protein